MRAPILHQLHVRARIRRPLAVPCALLLSWVAGCQAPSAEASLRLGEPGSVAWEQAVSVARLEVGTVLDDWHAAASQADAERYLGHIAPQASFLGTDAYERWDREAYEQYVTSNFEGPSPGWTYLPQDRHIELAPAGDIAWFDEVLERGGYREMRGTGIMVWQDGRWRIAQYNMSLTVPNEVAADVLSIILAYRRG